LSQDGFAYLVDFGTAGGAGETGLTGTGAVVGTRPYMAPDRFSTGLSDARSDIYARTCGLLRMPDLEPAVSRRQRRSADRRPPDGATSAASISCVATATKVSGSESMTSTLVLDKIDGRWIGVGVTPGACGNAPAEWWETMSRHGVAERSAQRGIRQPGNHILRATGR
jgi:serine/threonine protein kinase